MQVIPASRGNGARKLPFEGGSVDHLHGVVTPSSREFQVIDEPGSFEVQRVLKEVDDFCKYPDKVSQSMRRYPPQQAAKEARA